MPSSSIIIPFRNLLSVLLFLPLVLSCRQDDPILPALPTPGKGETAEVTLTLHIPDFRAANTRGVHEEKIDKITVLMFADEGGTEKVKVKKNISYTPFPVGGTSDPNTKIFSISVTAGTYKRIALVANAETELNNINVGSTYDDLKQVEVTGRFGQKGGAGADSYIPMYGEYAPAGGIEIKAGVPQTITQVIPLIRMLARVDIINPATSGAGTIAEEVYFVNPVGNGCVWVDLGTYNTDAAQSGYMEPTLPAVLQKANSGDPLRGMGNTGSPLITYYLNEQPATSATLTTSGYDRPCIVLQLSYQSNIYYYRLDYTWDGIKRGGVPPYEKGKSMPILRNHRYIFTIKEVKGPGFQTIEDALRSPENHTNPNIVVTSVMVDEAFTDVTFNDVGQYIAVSRTSMTLKGKKTPASTDNKVEVFTNVTGGFSVRAFNDDGTIPTGDWLQPSVSTSAANMNATVQAITDGKSFKNGYLEVRAGRLYTKVNVEQIGKMPLDYVAMHNLAGGSQYSAAFSSSDEPSGIPSTSAQSDSNVRWATSHKNNESGYYNWYVCNGIRNSQGNPSGKNLFSDAFFTSGAGKGYHLPSRWEWAGVFCYIYGYGISLNSSIIHNDINEAIEFGGIKKTFASDYANTGSNVTYALRFKPATGAPQDDSGSSEIIFPKATDNRMLCAYRYELIPTGAPLSSQIKVQAVYLGNSFTGDINTIRDENWWTAQAATPGNVVTRIFPLASEVQGSAILRNCGSRFSYQSSTAYYTSGGWQLIFALGEAWMRYDWDYNICAGGITVRPFSDE